MPYDVAETGSLTRKASVSIPHEEYQKDVDKALRKLAGRVKIRGFRKGKVPMDVLRQRYTDAVQQEVMQDVVNRYVDTIVKDAENVLFIDQPRVTRFNENGVGLAFEVAFELRPMVDPIGYLGVTIERPRIEVDPADIDKELEALREQFSSLEPIELRTTIKDGDVVTFDFEAVDKDDEELAKFKGEDAQLTLGDGKALAGMEEALRGAAFDATVTASITIPENYQVENLRGRTFDVELRIKSVKQRVLPELDDEFAADTGEAQTLLELRGKIRERLAHQQEHSAGHFAENDLMERLLDQNDFDLPPLFVRQQIDNKINQQLRQLQQQGLDLKNLNLNYDDIREGLRYETEEQLRAEFLLIAIAEKEQLQVTDEDMNRFFTHQAMHANATPEQVKRFYQQDRNRWQQAAGSALLEKTITFLLDKADVKEIDWPSEEEQQARAEARKERVGGKAPKAEKPAKPKAEKKSKSAKKAEAAAEEAPAAAAEPAVDPAEAFASMKVDELKELLKQNDLPVTGKKAELIDRLVEAGVKA